MNMNDIAGPIVTILTAIIGVALLAVLVSRNSQTPQVLKSAFGGFSEALKTALSPVSGGFTGGPPMSFGY